MSLADNSATMATDDATINAIEDAITTPQSVSADGVNVANRSLADQIAAKKFIDANNAVQDISSGAAMFGRVKVRPPGAQGGGRYGYY